jgi:hypothetical protein
LQATAQGSFTYQAPGDPSAVLPQLRAALLSATGRVLQQKLSSNQVALPTLAQSLPYFTQDIIAQSGAQQMGVRIDQLTLGVNVATPAPAAGAYQGALPPDPQTQLQNRMEQIAKQKLDPRNYEVEARINIGGFKVKASTDKGLDTQGLADQVTNKVRSEVTWWAIGCGVVALVVIGLAGLGFYIYRQAKGSLGPNTASAEDADEKKWDGKSELTCGGSDNIRVKGVTASLDDTAVTAQGNCRIELVDCDITAKTAISAGANAVVVVKGGKVTGKSEAASALGNAKITFDGTKVTGKKSALGGAKITGP